MSNLIYAFDENGKVMLPDEYIKLNADEFTRILFEKAGDRAGMVGFIEWLNSTDFFNAPCSTAFHLCINGGLCLHSIRVYEIFDELCDLHYPLFPAESRAICSLLHDICKTNTYKNALKSRKTGEYWPNGKAKWEDYVGFVFDEGLPYGHGEKSVYLIMKNMALTDEEAITIRWHMGGYDDGARMDPRTIGNASTKYPTIALLHAADLIATSQGF